MVSISTLEQEIKNTLSPFRFQHSLGVMKKAEELATVYQVDVEIAKLTGLAHDIAKEMSDQELLLFAKTHHLDIDPVELAKPTLLHGKVGAIIVGEKYNFTKEMQDAICFHTTGRKDMTMLDKIIYVADKIEDNRQKVPDELKELATQNIDVVLKYFYTTAMEKAIRKDSLLHPLTVEARNSLIIGQLRKEKE
ncbi:MAG TPA: bis(5'-nucleosyl)-tetraphosphatase (symmetrical) YqeK [Candidatus Scybalousia intestinigallinarum]|nr:bis(5'-nucleosyl)-tetraphosphatase (symmetrical) YqeK [Candidatus Scybalousia intestinigallinarum]